MTESYDIDAIIDAIPRMFTEQAYEKIEKEYANVRTRLNNMKKALKEGAASARKGIGMLKSNNLNFGELKKINDTVRKTDSKFMQSDDYFLLVKLMVNDDFEFVEDLFDEYDDDKAEAIRMYTKSLKYYEALLEKIPVLVELIDEAEVHLRSTN